MSSEVDRVKNGRLETRSGRASRLRGVALVTAVAMVSAACSSGGVVEHSDRIRLSEFGPVVNQTTNPAGDVASIYLTDFEHPEAKAGVALYRATGEQQMVTLPSKTTISAWGAVGSNFLVATYICSDDPNDLDGDCRDAQLHPTGALLIDDTGQTKEIAAPVGPIRTFVSNVDDLAIWQGDDQLVSYDLDSNTWSTIEFQRRSSFACPELGLVVSSEVSNGKPKPPGERTGQMIQTVSIDGAQVVGEAPLSEEGKVRPLACTPDGIVFQSGEGFETVSSSGEVVASVPTPPSLDNGERLPSCQPLAGPVPTALCALIGEAGLVGTTLVVDVGSPEQQTVRKQTGPIGAAPQAQALILTGEGDNSLALVRSDGQIETINP